MQRPIDELPGAYERLRSEKKRWEYDETLRGPTLDAVDRAIESVLLSEAGFDAENESRSHTLAQEPDFWDDTIESGSHAENELRRSIQEPESRERGAARKTELNEWR